jgi:hypothetical protein
LNGKADLNADIGELKKRWQAPLGV